MDSIEIYLPCELFPVQARFGLSDSLTTLEVLVLRAIHLGEHHVDQLAKMFGLSEKMLRDALMGLWHAGHLVFGSPGKKVYLSNRASKLISEGKLDELQRAASGFEEINLMFDLVCGHVLPVAGKTSPPSTAWSIPYTSNAIKLENLPYDAIVAAVERTRARRSSGMRVLNASIAFDRGANGLRMRWRKLEVACYRNSNDIHEVTVMDTGTVPYGVRRDISEYLSREIDYDHEGTDKHFFDRLRNKAMQGKSTRSGLNLEIDELEKRAQSLAASTVDQVTERHEQIADLASGVALAVADEISSVANLTPVLGREGHEKIILDLLNHAKHQVLIACPFVSGDGLAALRSGFKQAIGNGARVIILWGMQRRQVDGKEPYDALDQEVKNIVEDFRTRYPSHFFFSKRATGTHAKVFICDDAVLLTSLNILRPSHESVTEVGILAKPLDESGSEQLAIVADILTWAREIVPDNLVADAITVGQKNLRQVPPLPGMPLMDRDDRTAEQKRSDIAVWASQWVHFAEQLRHLRGLQPTVRLVRDGQHRGLLELAIRSTKRRLIVTSDQLSTDAVRPSTRESLLRLGEAGAVVRLVYRSPSRQKIIEGTAAEELLREIDESARLNGYDVQTLKTPNHSKVLVFDDTAVITSFNFLSHSGQYGAGRGSRIAELGLLLSGPGVADSVVEALARAMPFLRPISDVSHEMGPEATLQDDELISKILDGLESGSILALEQAFAESDDAWQLLDLLTNRSTIRNDEVLVRRLAAICMATAGPESNPMAYGKWAKVLARESWSRGNVIEAYLLLASAIDNVGEDEHVPHISVVEIAAKRVAGFESNDWSAIELEKVSKDARAVLGITALAEAVETGSRDAADFAEIVSADLSDSWRKVATDALTFLNVSFDHFPHSAFISPGQSMSGFKFEREFKILRSVLEHNSQKQFGFRGGRDIWLHLFGPQGTFSKLLSAAQAGDATAVHEWFENLETTNPAEILTAAVHSTLGSDREKVLGSEREALENSIRNILQAAAAIEKLSARTRFDYDAQVLLAAKKFCREIRAEWPRVVDETKTVIEPRMWPLLSSVLKQFETLVGYSAQ
jgi:phosphatidylserine/phosphatidylglycerophosphate/cardiolipin synthase-like enzyme